MNKTLITLFILVNSNSIVSCAGHEAGRSRGVFDVCAKVDSCGSYCTEWESDGICKEFHHNTSEYCAEILTKGRYRC